MRWSCEQVHHQRSSKQLCSSAAPGDNDDVWYGDNNIDDCEGDDADGDDNNYDDDEQCFKQEHNVHHK